MVAEFNSGLSFFNVVVFSPASNIIKIKKMARKHRLDEVLRTLSQKKDLRIFGQAIQILSDKIWSEKDGKYITNPNKSFDLGNGSWGKIDFLTKYNGYIINHIEKF